MDRGLYQRTIKNLATGRSGRLSIAAALTFFITTAPAFGQAILEGERFHPVTATQGMVATSHTLATEVALEVLKNGGNAIDAAVTAGFCTCCHPAPFRQHWRWRFHADFQGRRIRSGSH